MSARSNTCDYSKMSPQRNGGFYRHRCTPESLQRRWDELCAKYLPVTDGDSIWRFSRTGAEGDLDQGWKLHVSATILNAPHILERLAPVLVESGVQFKAPRSLDDVLRQNSGVLQAYSQVGKIITVYPRSDYEAVHLAKRLHTLTYRFKAPSVPFDSRFSNGSNVYYRYGAFKKMDLERDGRRVPALISSGGELVPDVREKPRPEWASDPFLGSNESAPKHKAAISSSFRVVRALVQRGKGGVYQAIDAQSHPPRPCLLKEGRRLGELNWDGRDGAWRVRNEERVLSQLSRFGLNVPRVYSRFEVQGNVYLAMEFIDGESLHQLLQKQHRRLSIRSVLSLGIQIATLLEQMHGAGWAWRDCKPTNLIVKSDGGIVPIDFEGAEQINRPDALLWGTRGFTPLVSRAQTLHTGLTDDLFALGSILFLLLSGQMFDEAQPTSIAKWRRNVPPRLRLLVDSLLAVEPNLRPTAKNVRTQLTSILREHSQKSRKLPALRAA